MPRVVLKTAGRSSRADVNSGWTAKLIYAVWEVDDEADVYTAVDDISGLTIPTTGSGHPMSGSLHCTSVEAQQEDRPDAWEVTVEYQSPTIELGEPLDQQPEWDWDLGIIGGANGYDANGKPILNSAGSVFSENPPDEIASLFLKVYLNEPFYNPPTAYQLFNKVNETQINLFGTYLVQPGQLRVVSYRPTRRIRFSDTFTPTEWIFELGEGELIPGTTEYSFHQHRILDRGFSGWMSGPKTGLFFRGLNDPVTDEELLDGTGLPVKTSIKVSESLASAIATPAANLPAFMGKKTVTEPASTFLFYRRCQAVSLNGLIAGVM